MLYNQGLIFKKSLLVCLNHQSVFFSCRARIHPAPRCCGEGTAAPSPQTPAASLISSRSTPCPSIPRPHTPRWHQSPNGRWLQMTAASTQSVLFNKRHRTLGICRKPPGFLPCLPWSIDVSELKPKSLSKRGLTAHPPNPQKGSQQDSYPFVHLSLHIKEREERPPSPIILSSYIKTCRGKNLFFSKPAFHTDGQPSVFQGAKKSWWDYSWFLIFSSSFLLPDFERHFRIY